MLIIKLEGNACFLPSNCPTYLLSRLVEPGFSWGEKGSFFVAQAGPTLVKHLQTALAHMPTLAEKIPQENWEKNGCFLSFQAKIER